MPSLMPEWAKRWYWAMKVKTSGYSQPQAQGKGWTGSARPRHHLGTPALPPNKAVLSTYFSKALCTDGNTCELQVLCAGCLHWESWGMLMSAPCSATSPPRNWMANVLSKKVIKQTHPYPIMPYALFYMGNFLSLFILSILLSPPLWKDDMTTEVWKAFPYFCNTHSLTFWVFFKRTVTGQHSPTPERGTATWAKVLEQPQVTAAPMFKQTLPGSLWVSHRSALNVERWNRYPFWCTYEVLAMFWCQLCAPAQGSSPGALCANRASCMTASLGWMALGSGSMGTGDPSLDRLSGVWTPLECADNTPEWLGEAGALLQSKRKAAADVF